MCLVIAYILGVTNNECCVSTSEISSQVACKCLALGMTKNVTEKLLGVLIAGTLGMHDSEGQTYMYISFIFSLGHPFKYAMWCFKTPTVQGYKAYS